MNEKVSKLVEQYNAACEKAYKLLREITENSSVITFDNDRWTNYGHLTGEQISGMAVKMCQKITAVDNFHPDAPPDVHAPTPHFPPKKIAGQVIKGR